MNLMKYVKCRQHGTIAPLIRASRGEPVIVDQLKRAVIGGIDLALERLGSDKQTSDAFKEAREKINESHRQIA